MLVGDFILLYLCCVLFFAVVLVWFVIFRAAVSCVFLSIVCRCWFCDCFSWSISVFFFFFFFFFFGGGGGLFACFCCFFWGFFWFFFFFFFVI